jgi:hypothetical protein
MGALPGMDLSIYGSAPFPLPLSLSDPEKSTEELSMLFGDIFFTYGPVSAEYEKRILALYNHRDQLKSATAPFQWYCERIRDPKGPIRINATKQIISGIFVKEEFIRSLVEYAIYINGPSGVSGVNIERAIRQIVGQVGEMYDDDDDDEPEEIKEALMRDFPDYEKIIDFAIYEIEHTYELGEDSPKSHVLKQLNHLEVQSLKAVKRISLQSPETILAIIECIGVVLTSELPHCGALISLATVIKNRFLPYASKCAPIEYNDLGGQQLPPKAQALKILLEALLDTIAEQNCGCVGAIIDPIEAILIGALPGYEAIINFAIEDEKNRLLLLGRERELFPAIQGIVLLLGTIAEREPIAMQVIIELLNVLFTIDEDNPAAEQGIGESIKGILMEGLFNHADIVSPEMFPSNPEIATQAIDYLLIFFKNIASKWLKSQLSPLHLEIETSEILLNAISRQNPKEARTIAEALKRVLLIKFPSEKEEIDWRIELKIKVLLAGHNITDHSISLKGRPSRRVRKLKTLLFQNPSIVESMIALPLQS